MRIGDPPGDDWSLLAPFNPVNEIDDVLFEMSTHQPEGLDWMVVHSVAQRSRKQCESIARGETLDLSWVQPTRTALRTPINDPWRPLLEHLMQCPDMPSMIPLLTTLELHAHKVLYESGFFLPPTDARRGPKLPTLH